MYLKLKWVNRNTTAVTVNIYRSDTPIDRANLPTPLVSLTNGETEYVDTTVIRGNTYYYVFETVSATDRVVSNNHTVVAGPRRGPGPQQLKYGNLEYGYFGTINAFDFLKTYDLRNQVGLTLGTVTNASPVWHKYARNNKILFVPNSSITSGISWDQLYNLGLVYGVDGPGVGSFLPSTPVNQLKTVVSGPDTFIVRLMTGYSDNPLDVPPSNENTTEPMDSLRCEWEDLIYPLSRFTPTKQRIPNVESYSRGDMNFNSIYNIHCQERASDTVNIGRGSQVSDSRATVATRKTYNSTQSSSIYGWWPVLELVESSS